MKKLMVAITIFIGMNSVVNAGWFDFLKVEEQKEEVKTVELKKGTMGEQEEEVKSTDGYDYVVPRLERLSYETTIKDTEYLKSHYEEIQTILVSFAALENNLMGYEEKSVVTNLKNYFKDKYLIRQTDLIKIRSNLNEIIK
jgi:hypothetical protein